jgi:hypothetical protein
LTPLPLSHRASEAGEQHCERHLARGGGGPRARRTFPPRSPAAWIQKERGAVRDGDKANHPTWGFPPPLLGGGLGEEEEGGRALLRRAVGGEGQAVRAATLR